MPERTQLDAAIDLLIGAKHLDNIVVQANELKGLLKKDMGLSPSESNHVIRTLNQIDDSLGNILAFINEE